GPRAQCDRNLYPVAVRCVLDELESLDLFQEMVSDLVLEGARVTGVRTRGGITFYGTAVVVTAGTFLRGRIHMGQEAGVGAGRAGEAPSIALAEGLESLGLEMARFKTGTPPRIDGRSVDFSRVERQDGDDQAIRFAAYTEEIIPAQRPCWVTWASDGLKKVVSDNLQKSALHGGEISGRGPRYCPSIEDKVIRFPNAPRHQVFLEPEGLHTTELYVNGLSTSLPADVQRDFLQTVPGLENVVMTKAGYAIEYDYFPPHQLRHSLELKEIASLFFAGQINGTTGYEEAAGQGVIAGINAALKVKGEDPFILRRDQAYIGVLIDDLVTRGVDEPYRLFTSRAEFRLLLRQDNAIRRLGLLARDVGLLTEKQALVLKDRLDQENKLIAWFHDTKLAPNDVDPLLIEAGSGPLSGPVRAVKLLRRPRVRATDLLSAGSSDSDIGNPQEGLRAGVLSAVEVELKYEGYVGRERERAARLEEQSKLLLDYDLPYLKFETLSYESREKLARIRPETFAQAARVPGVSPADLQNLLLEVRRTRTREKLDP
ncbi:MAG: tRNA uridine-5-carboxymethylaminomethyl(34) synthesis enzyme MnmG, partial [Gemmatimonadota bacterium]|nr:tRNA uridine-5-carboxymethylaminomethyl(34) synthesis enzyme MnmG [Gemmatimonadota bacterium]